ncbi:hypothetical protein Vafri_14004 [Volvox africanus]|uniref:Uncharacterized protein n=1 Tax=Volvox africanus TaxID=51714 RepID=A0A8J4BD32_9CHLO|nr:hypothetical protein Vafri_14004 [Volvox africanus]
MYGWEGQGIHIHTYTLTHLHTYTHTHIHTYTLTHLHTYTLTHLHTYTHTHIHTYTHTHIHTYTHTHMVIATHLVRGDVERGDFSPHLVGELHGQMTKTPDPQNPHSEPGDTQIAPLRARVCVCVCRAIQGGGRSRGG